MILSDFHVHTTFSDGKNTPEEMVLQAIKLGLKAIGFSDHSYTAFDTSFCIQAEDLENYRNTIARLKEKYKDKIQIFCGIEQDLYSLADTTPYDYVIGSVHYVKAGDHYISVDESMSAFQETVAKYFAGDPVRFAQEYYKNVAEVPERTGADIIGHFDLIAKFNDAHLFDEQDARYISAWKNAADRLLAYGKPFEINMGAISRGYKKTPYPAENILRYLQEKGGTFVLSSDAHGTSGLCFGFDAWMASGIGASIPLTHFLP